MDRQKVLWGLIIVLIATVWISFRIMSETDQNNIPEKEKEIIEEENKEIIEEEYNEVPVEESLEDEALSQTVKLGSLGHAAFLLEIDDFTVLMDPYSPQVGYGELKFEADLITVSHEHVDHNYVDAAPGAKVLQGLSPDGLGWEDISFTEKGIEIFNIPAYHDDKNGKLRGLNSIFVFDLEDIRVVHMGDLGHLLSEEEVEKLSPVDVLLLPVGDHYTIGASEASQLVDELEPAVAVPMHYRTEVTRNWPISNVDTFIEGRENVVEKKDKFVSINKDELPQNTEIWLMKQFVPSQDQAED